MSKQDLRDIFDAYTDPGAADLVNVLSTAQKVYGADWIARVTACMYGMEIHDAGGFPEAWLDELEDDSLEAYNNARMKG